MANKKDNQQTLGEEIANAISHGLVVPFSIVIFYIYWHLLPEKTPKWPLFLFSTSMFVLYMTSCLYHALSFTKLKKNFQKLDHIGIYLLIWGNFLPFLFFNSSNNDQINLIFFVIQTIIVFLGILFKFFWVYKGKKIHLFLYLILGWGGAIILCFLKENINQNKIVLFWLILGGIFYTIGVYFYNNLYKKYYHFIWHLFVILGNFCHFLSIYYFLK